METTGEGQCKGTDDKWETQAGADRFGAPCGFFFGRTRRTGTAPRRTPRLAQSHLDDPDDSLPLAWLPIYHPRHGQLNHVLVLVVLVENRAICRRLNQPDWP